MPALPWTGTDPAAEAASEVRRLGGHTAQGSVHQMMQQAEFELLMQHQMNIGLQ